MRSLLRVFFLPGLFMFGTACASASPDANPLPEAAFTAAPLASETAENAPTIVPLPTITLTQTEIPSPTPIPATPTETQPPEPSRFPDPAGYSWQLVASGLERPVGIASAGDGSGRLFVLEQPGRIRIVQGGQLLPEPFLDIQDRVGCCGERGLLGLAFHPQFPQNGYFYVNYTDLNGDTVIARFQAADDLTLAVPDSEFRILGVGQPYPNHNGGALAFGPDGYLYIGLGDGGSAGDPLGNGQNTNYVLGKILRLDVTTPLVGSVQPYLVPPDNPFNQGGGTPEVWAYGLRNPWRFSFDRLTGDLYIGDVGQNAWEEIDFLPAGSPGGANFGWNYREGAHPFAGDPPAGMELIDPVAEYDHSQGITVIGGHVYRGSRLPEWQGIYLYGDYGSGQIWGLFRDAAGVWQNTLLFQLSFTITSFGEDESGEIYLVDYAGGLYRLEGN